MKLLADARQLADFITSLTDFELSSHQVPAYQHMGATIADCILQAGLNYRNVVEPRVNHIQTCYPAARTVSGFHTVLEIHGAGNVLNWKHPEKPRRVCDLTVFLSCKGIETVDDLRVWLLSSENCEDLLQLKGIGQKTVDYLKKCIGISTVAVDRHIRSFIQLAGLCRNGYDEIKLVVSYTADLLNVPRSNLDHAIWIYQSTRSEQGLSSKRPKISGEPHS